MLFNLDQVDGPRNKLVFRVTDTVNLLGGVVRQSSGNAETIVFSEGIRFNLFKHHN